MLSQTNVAVTQNVDLNFGQLAYYTMTAKAPVGTAKVRVQSSIGCNYIKMDAWCLRSSVNAPLFTTATNNREKPLDAKVSKFYVTASPNPATSFFNLGISSNDAAILVRVRILSFDGRILSEQKSVTNSTLRIRTDQWLNGVYFVEVTQADRRKIVKVIIAN